MVYLKNITTEQALFVPKTGAVPQGDLSFVAKSTIDLDVKVNQAVVDLITSKYYFKFNITLPENLPDGEYEYSVKAGNETIASGLLVIGTATKPSQLNEEKTYTQYDPSK
jgi:hypothetical protein